MTRTSHLLGLATSPALAATTTTGCGPFGTEQDGPVELTVRASVTDRSAMDAVVAEFHRLDPGTHVTVDHSDTGDLQQELPGELRAGDGPDVFTVWPGNGNPASVTALEHDDLLENLTLRRFNLTMPIGVKPVTDVNGSTFAVPVALSGIGTVFSMGALDAIGGAPPRTWTELLTLCDKARDHGKVLLALANTTPLGHPTHHLRPGRDNRPCRRTGLRQRHGTRQGNLHPLRLYNRSGATLPAIPNPSFTVDPAIKGVAERQKATRCAANREQPAAALRKEAAGRRVGQARARPAGHAASRVPVHPERLGLDRCGRRQSRRAEPQMHRASRFPRLCGIS